MYNLTELKESLKTIREVCNSFEDGCDGCPLCDTEEHCQLRGDCPDSWDIEEKTIIVL